ncbi:MAG: hypothetical protein ACOY94_07265 [Bacillota bacterium]
MIWRKSKTSLVVVVTLALVASVSPASAVEDSGDKPSVIATIHKSDGTPARGAVVELLLYEENKVVEINKTNLSGRTALHYRVPRAFVEDRGREVVDVHLALRVWAEPDEFAVYHFTQRFVRSDSRLPAEDIRKIQGPPTQTFDIKTTKVKPYKPKKEKGDVSVAFCWPSYEETMPSKSTTVGEVHSTDGVTATFKYSQGSAMTIETKTTYDAGKTWSVSGSTSITNNITLGVTWPPFAPASGYGREALSQFDYKRVDWGCDIGIAYTDVYPIGYVGGTNWGYTTYGVDDAPYTAIENNLKGHWSSYLPGSQFDMVNGTGRKFGVVVKLPVLGTNLELGGTTNYTSETKISFAFSPKYSMYYLYDNCSSCSPAYQTIYLSHR